MILRCDFCYKHVDAIRKGGHVVKLDNATTVPIVLKPSPRPKDLTTLPEHQELLPLRKLESPKNLMVNLFELAAESQNLGPDNNKNRRINCRHTNITNMTKIWNTYAWPTHMLHKLCQTNLFISRSPTFDNQEKNYFETFIVEIKSKSILLNVIRWYSCRVIRIYRTSVIVAQFSLHTMRWTHSTTKT